MTALLKRAEADWPLGAFVEKVSGSSWRGKVVGYYATNLTLSGVAVESFFEPNSVQIYPSNALKAWQPPADTLDSLARENVALRRKLRECGVELIDNVDEYLASLPATEGGE